MSLCAKQKMVVSHIAYITTGHLWRGALDTEDPLFRISGTLDSAYTEMARLLAAQYQEPSASRAGDLHLAYVPRYLLGAHWAALTFSYGSTARPAIQVDTNQSCFGDRRNHSLHFIQYNFFEQTFLTNFFFDKKGLVWFPFIPSFSFRFISFHLSILNLHPFLSKKKFVKKVCQKSLSKKKFVIFWGQRCVVHYKHRVG